PMANGKIFLNPKLNISVTETNITALAFDYANNLYVASSASKTLSRYAIPSDVKQITTPGNGIGDAIPGDVNGDGEVDVADYTYILNLMADEAYDVKGDVNKDGEVDVADATYVLNIMADQE
ncbi:MAG: dockerin type I repeat-containing protein, partial [Bacteroidaceae bacterium]|nr:dockerin type I repeat-containing protein [Bacteroidaceae bacterium]